MKWILLILFVSNSAVAQEQYSLFLTSSNTDFSWNQIVPLNEAKDYTFKSYGIGLEKQIFDVKDTEFYINTGFQKGNYANIVSLGASFFPNFYVGAVKISPEFNLGFDYIKSTSDSPHQVNQISFYSKIGPRISFKQYGVGIYNYYSSLFGDTSLHGWSLSLFYSF